MSTKHTPTPWKVEADNGIYATSDGVHLASTWIRQVSDVIKENESWLQMRDRTQPLRDTAKEEGHANAAFIVRACNSHESLVAALEETLAEAIGWLDESRGCHPTNLMDHGWYDRAKAALAAAAGVA